MWEQSKSDPGLFYEIEKEAAYIAQTSLCPLGQSPVLSIKSALYHFKIELITNN
jgi:NADH:ubiquinone oxidoreductase subunit F (NADH-binding)